MFYDFDTVVDRRNTNSLKWDMAAKLTGVDDVLPLWVADMDFPAPAPVLDALQQRAAHGVFGYSVVPDSCYEAAMRWIHKRHHWDIEKDWIVFTTGVVPAIHWIVMAWTQPGDKVIIQPPVYHPFFQAARVNGCHVLENPLKLEHGRYVMDFDHLERILDERTKVFILCSPHNPVGRVWTREELGRLGEICAKHQVLLCSDEIHWDLALYGASHLPTASISEEIAQNTITLIAPNKTFNLAGISIALAIMPNATVRAAFLRMHKELGIHLAGNVFGAIAAEAAYTHGEEWLEHLVLYIQENLEFLTRYLEQHIPQITVIQPEGTYLAWLNFQALGMGNSELKDFLLKEAKVWLNDGPSFGTGGAGFQRLNLACPRSVLQDALQRIEQAVKRVV